MDQNEILSRGIPAAGCRQLDDCIADFFVGKIAASHPLDGVFYINVAASGEFGRNDQLRRWHHERKITVSANNLNLKFCREYDEARPDDLQVDGVGVDFALGS